MWSTYHGALSDSNSNKKPKKRHGLTLHAQVFNHADHLCRSIPLETRQSNDGQDAIVKASCKHDRLSAASYLFDDFSSLLETKRDQNESFKIFESRFSAQMSRYNGHGTSIVLPGGNVTLLLLANAKVGDLQRVPILSYTSAKTYSTVTATTTNDDVINKVEYRAVALVILQCDNESTSSNRPSTTNNTPTLSGNSVRKPQTPEKYSNSSVPCRISAVQLRQYKLKICDSCGKNKGIFSLTIMRTGLLVTACPLMRFCLRIVRVEIKTRMVMVVQS